ncbi:MAG TPA: sensor domain-containing diguanylate cyclase [Solirubrobacterales bacterium]|nr:sensor domain-containing diguanylate cyclase [Solirubrobacterales bacterium]
MGALPKNYEALRTPGRSEARSVGALLLAGAGLVVLSLALPHPGGGDTAALLATAATMAVAGLLCWFLARRIPLAATHLVLAATAALTGLLIYESGVAVGQYGSIFVWVTLVAAYFFPRRAAVAHLVWLLAVYGVTLALVESTAGYSPLTRWLFTAISLTVVMLLTAVLVARSEQASLRGRRFFELSRDMLCTFDRSGNAIELNSAWEDSLGYSAAELRALPPFALVHPDEREHNRRGVERLFAGAEDIGFENRYLAKDGSWHWLHWSAALAPDESLIYARATDVTELKRVESERENLLTEVAALARSDALTGLPNRRVLDDQLPREMARARRAGSELCLAILDLDRFKVYNDTYGHLAGDVMLRDCAIAWDSELRGEDTIVRYGGEEFLVVLPDCTFEHAAEIIERLRDVTPGAQTCSAGLACWDFAELAVDLVGRADSALYRAKAAGRDRLVRAPRIES